jgi:hypothetical protein
VARKSRGEELRVNKKVLASLKRVGELLDGACTNLYNNDGKECLRGQATAIHLPEEEALDTIRLVREAGNMLARIISGLESADLQRQVATPRRMPPKVAGAKPESGAKGPALKRKNHNKSKGSEKDNG